MLIWCIASLWNFEEREVPRWQCSMILPNQKLNNFLFLCREVKLLHCVPKIQNRIKITSVLLHRKRKKKKNEKVLNYLFMSLVTTNQVTHPDIFLMYKNDFNKQTWGISSLDPFGKAIVPPVVGHRDRWNDSPFDWTLHVAQLHVCHNQLEDKYLNV